METIFLISKPFVDLFESNALVVMKRGGDEKENLNEISLNNLINFDLTKSRITLFLDASKYSVFNFAKLDDESDTKYKARFFSEKEDLIISDISKTKINFHNKRIVLTELSMIEKLSKYLSNLGCEVSVFPDIVLQEDFADYEDQNLKEIWNANNINNINLEKNYVEIERTLENALEHSGKDNFYKKFASMNLFRFKFSLKNIQKKLQLVKRDLFFLLFLTFTLFSIPFFQIIYMQNAINNYKNATNEIFNQLNPNIRVVNPRAQIDNLLNSQNLPIVDEFSFDDSYFQFLDRFNLEFIKSTEISIGSKIIIIDIQGMPINQFTFAKSLFKNFGLSIVNDSTNTLDDKIFGTITLRYL